MRVVHVNHVSHPGGAELALVRLLSGEPPWQAGVCCPPGGTAFDGLAVHGVEVQRVLTPLPGGGTRGNSVTVAAKYLAALRASAGALRASHLVREADLVHANTAAAAISCGLADRGLAAKGARVPLVVHLRDLVTPASLGRFGFEAFTRLGLVRAAGVIANSQATLRSAEHRLADGVHRVVLQSPSGIRQRTDRPVVAERIRAVGMVGRLQAWKGQHVFIEAFARVFAGTGVRAYLAGAALFGEEAYRRRLVELAGHLGIADQVVLLGHVDDVDAFIESVDVLVHASTRPEPMGQTVLQGLAHAKPIVATEGGGPSEWIRSGDNGLLIRPDDVEALAAALRTLDHSPELRGRIAAGAAATPGLLTDDECVRAHAEFFDAVRGRGRDPDRPGSDRDPDGTGSDRRYPQ